MYSSGYNFTNTPEKEPTEVRKACNGFIRSPLILCAIIAYTIYAGISAVEGWKLLSNLDNTIRVMNVSFLMGFGMLLLQLLAFQPIIVTVGLWKMFTSGGNWGADTVRFGISAYVGGGIGSLSCILVGFIFESESMDILSILFEESFLPMAFMIFAMVAISSLRGFAESVEYTAQSGKACTDGVVKAGILIAIYLGLTLIITMNAAEAYAIASALQINSFGTVSLVARLGSLLLFCISAFVFNNMIQLASAEDEKAPVVVVAPTWQCSCGQVNRDYVYTCVCGAQKRDITTPNGRVNATTPPVAQPASGHPTSENAERPVIPVEYIFCSECGCKCQAQAKFCKACGSKLIH